MLLLPRISVPAPVLVRARTPPLSLMTPEAMKLSASTAMVESEARVMPPDQEWLPRTLEMAPAPLMPVPFRVSGLFPILMPSALLKTKAAPEATVTEPTPAAPKAAPFCTITVPELTVVVPVNVLAALSVSDPEPLLVRLPAPLMMPSAR